MLPHDYHEFQQLVYILDLKKCSNISSHLSSPPSPFGQFGFISFRSTNWLQIKNIDENP